MRRVEDDDGRDLHHNKLFTIIKELDSTNSLSSASDVNLIM
jgi:hypothetical protein